MTPVPNQFPRTSSTDFRLAIIGEAPGDDEIRERIPFIGSSGRMLRAILHASGIDPSKCFLGNVCQYKPPRNQINSFAFDGPEIQNGINQLRHDLQVYKPNCVLALGTTALRAFGESRSLSALRGSLFISPTFGYKTLGSYHPAACLRNYSWTFYLRYDVFRARQEATSQTLDLPQRDIRIGIQLGDVLNYLMYLRQAKPKIAFDVEGYPEKRGITCLSIFDSPFSGMTIPFYKLDGTACWSLDEEVYIWEQLNAILADPEIAKIAQNALYELFVFAWSHRIIVRNIAEDTMLKHWEFYNELEKSLAIQASIYTREPYWKDERVQPDSHTHWIYCGKDSAVTYEISEVLERQLAKAPEQYNHYRFNIEMLRPYLYLELKGCRVDTHRLQIHQQRLAEEIVKQQNAVNAMVGFNFNVKSNPQKQHYLYDILGLPLQYKKQPGKAEQTITGDEEAVLNLYLQYDKPELLELLKLIRLRTDFSDSFKVLPTTDGRTHCSYNLVGTETGRLSSSETAVYGVEPMPQWMFKKDSFELKFKPKKFRYGTNVQNQSKWIRDIYVPDEGFAFFQLDLAGADAWTVAADLAALGNDTMLQDLYHGIKPAKVIMLMRQFGLAVNTWSRDEIKERQNTVDSDGPMYLCAKRCQHGSNYGMFAKRIVALVRKDSARKDLNNIINLAPAVAQQMQELYKARYHPELRQAYVQRQLEQTGGIRTACGIFRKFTSLRSRTNIDQATIREALAEEPQANTTYATNRALYRLYYDKINRNADGSLFVQPQIMVHDALAGQFPLNRKDECLTILRESFKNPLTINNITLTIPADGGWGANWKNLPNEI